MEDEITIYIFDFDDVLMPTRKLVDAYVKKYCELGTEKGWENRIREFANSFHKETNQDKQREIIKAFKKDEEIHDELQKMVENDKNRK